MWAFLRTFAYCALTLLPIAGMAATAWAADAFDGVYRGDLLCMVLPGQTIEPFKVSMTVTVARDHVEYSRNVLSPDGREAIGTESGIGTVTPNGGIALGGTASGNTYRAAGFYQGKIAGRSMALAGIQDLAIQGRPSIRRNCFASLAR